MKKILVCAVLFVSLGILAACNGKDDGKVEISFSWWGTSERNIATHQAIKLFEEKYPQYKVEADQSPWSGYQTSLTNRLNRGREADVFQVNYNWIYQLDGVEYFMDLNELGIDFSKYPESEHKPLTVDGKVLGLSLSETGYIFYLNKKIYEDAGITEIPETWDELIEAGKKIKAYDPNKYALGRLDSQQVAMLMFSWLAQKYGRNVIGKDNKLNFTAKELKEAFNFIDVLRNNNVLIYSYKSDTHNYGPTNPHWQTRQNYGGIMQWNTAVSEYRNTLPNPENMVMAGMFQQNKGEKLGMYKKSSMAYAVSKRVEKSEKKKEAVRTFLEFMTTDPEAIRILGVDRGVSSNPDVQEILLSDEQNNFKNSLEWQGHEVVQEYFNHQLELGQNLYIHPYYEHDTFRQVYELPIEKFLLRDVTADQAINEIISRFDTQLEAVMRG